jgi:hypothetical protein
LLKPWKPQGKRRERHYGAERRRLRIRSAIARARRSRRLPLVRLRRRQKLRLRPRLLRLRRLTRFLRPSRTREWYGCSHQQHFHLSTSLLTPPTPKPQSTNALPTDRTLNGHNQNSQSQTSTTTPIDHESITDNPPSPVLHTPTKFTAPSCACNAHRSNQSRKRHTLQTSQRTSTAADQLITVAWPPTHQTSHLPEIIILFPVTPPLPFAN